MLLSHKLTTISHPIMSHAPVMTNGNITPKIVHKFKTHCATYFMNAKDGVADKLKVTKILGCFENNLVADWASTEQEHLAKLSFKEFMKRVQRMLASQWLGTNHLYHHAWYPSWPKNTLLRNLGSSDHVPQHLTPKHTLLPSWRPTTIPIGYNDGCWAPNSCPEPKHIRNKRLAQMDVKNPGQYQTTSLHTGPYQAPWTLGTFTNACIVAWNPNTSSTSNASTSHPLQLTEEEWHILHKHKGCLKCHEFYIGHCTNICTITLTGNGYRTHTLQDTLRAKPPEGVHTQHLHPCYHPQLQWQQKLLRLLKLPNW